MIYLPASCAEAGIVKADAVLTRAAQVEEEAVDKFPDDRYPSML